MAGPTAAFIVTVVVSAVLLTFVHRSPPSQAGTNAASWRATADDFVVPDWFSSLPVHCMAGTSLGVAAPQVLAYVSGVRTGVHAGHDLVTIQFTSERPAGTTISAQFGTTFALGSGGKVVSVEGTYGALVAMQTADGHTHYSGPSDIKPGDRTIRELRKIRDDGGLMEWAIGLSQVPCFRAAYLDHPARLVIDFQ